MTTYEVLLQEASNTSIHVYENYDLNGDCDSATKLCGIYIDGNIALDKSLKSCAEKSCVLAEEIGHHKTSFGNILDQVDVGNQRQELRARMWAYDRQIGLLGIIRCFEAGCRSLTEMAEFLDVTEEFLKEALERYRQKYGICTSIDQYIIYFEPRITIMKINV